MLLIWCCNSLD